MCLKIKSFLGICSAVTLLWTGALGAAEEVIEVTTLPPTMCGLHFQNFSNTLQKCEGTCLWADYKVILAPYSWQDKYIFSDSSAVNEIAP